jgi:hypothetical protein
MKQIPSLLASRSFIGSAAKILIGVTNRTPASRPARKPPTLTACPARALPRRPSPSPTNRVHTHLDVSRLDQWEIVLDHAQKLGLFLHFKTQESENQGLLDGGETYEDWSSRKHFTSIYAPDPNRNH